MTTLPPPPDPAHPLADTEWELGSFGAADAPTPATARAATIRFAADGTVSGFSGCNRYHGRWGAAADQLLFGAIASTRMACLDPAALAQEAALFAALRSGLRPALDGDRLELIAAEMVLRFRRQA